MVGIWHLLLGVVYPGAVITIAPYFRLCLLVCALSILASCGKAERKAERSAVDVKLLSTDVHVAIAQRSLVLPFIALDDYAYGKQSFSLDRKGDRERTLGALNQLLRDSADPKKPMAFDGLSVVVRTYGWNDFDTRQRQVCPLLTREWARSVCDNPSAAIQQALPSGRFMLVDLRRLQLSDPRGPARCIDDGKPPRRLPERPGKAEIVCKAQVYGGRDDQYQRAVVRIDGDLGALWMVWRFGQNGETAEAMTEREGRAIVAFVKNGLGSREDFPVFHDTACSLRRPRSVDGPSGPDCSNATLPIATRNPK